MLTAHVVSDVDVLFEKVVSTTFESWNQIAAWLRAVNSAGEAA
jgi:hypothetical protein